MKHIDEWLEERTYGTCKEDEKYAVAFFILIGMNAVFSWAIRPIMKEHKLFCEWKGKKYRVTGCSTIGDIWLHEDFTKDTGYKHRVDIEECSKWAKTE